MRPTWRRAWLTRAAVRHPPERASGYELTELKRSDNMADVLLADHGLYHLEADLRWIDHTAARLDQLAQAVRR